MGTLLIHTCTFHVIQIGFINSVKACRDHQYFFHSDETVANFDLCFLGIILSTVVASFFSFSLTRQHTLYASQNWPRKSRYFELEPGNSDQNQNTLLKGQEMRDIVGKARHVPTLTTNEPSQSRQQCATGREQIQEGLICWPGSHYLISAKRWP